VARPDVTAAGGFTDRPRRRRVPASPRRGDAGRPTGAIAAIVSLPGIRTEPLKGTTAYDVAMSADDQATATADGPCSVIDAIQLIGSQWRLVVLHDLREGEKRFNELKRSTGANARTLSRVLDDLQSSGFVARRMEADAPVATYYSLTPQGQSLCPVFEEIETWADEWLGDAADGEAASGHDEGEGGNDDENDSGNDNEGASAPVVTSSENART
jgi:DNA-binding HxlR family transcriptional regulator